MTTTSAASMCELNSRVSDGIDVQLMWCKDDDRLWVLVTDGRQGESFLLAVADGERAMDVFHHPFAYAAHHGVAPQPTSVFDAAGAGRSAGLAAARRARVER